MGKAVRLLALVVLTGLLALAVAGPASAATVDPTACWNNCGIGGGTTITN